LQAFDAARGLAMLFVCVSHFGFVYFRRMPAHELEYTLITRVSMIATPTFVVLSGLMLGFLYRTRRYDIPELRAKLIDRALFMLTIGHVAIVLAEPAAGAMSHALRWGYITDVIALGLLVGPVLVDRIPPGRRLALATALYATAWAAFVGWRPEPMALKLAKECFFGPLESRLTPGTFPVLPWLAVYIAATVIGEHLGALRAAEMKVMLTRLALACFFGALAVKAIPFGLRALGVLAPNGFIWALGWPFHKTPPSPTYLGLYGGLGLLMIRGLLAIDERPAVRRWLSVPAALGRASLVAFIAQAYLYFTVIAWWNHNYSAFWPVLLIASVGVVLAIGLWWERAGSNDVLGVGYRALISLVRRRAAHA
jgi:uncharacterized membrane protein